MVYNEPMLFFFLNPTTIVFIIVNKISYYYSSSQQKNNDQSLLVWQNKQISKRECIKIWAYGSWSIQFLVLHFPLLKVLGDDFTFCSRWPYFFSFFDEMMTILYLTSLKWKHILVKIITFIKKNWQITFIN